MSTPASEIIQASAGSGKTYTLIERYVRLLRIGANPKSILATTFTRKAAGEILQRTLRRLADRHSDQVETALLRRVIHDLPELAVQTIDATFARVASGAALTLRQPPGWRPIEADEAEELTDDALDAALAGIDEEELATLLIEFQGARFGSAPRNATRRVIEGAAAAIRINPDVPWYESSGSRSTQSLRNELDRCAEITRKLSVPTTKKGDPSKTWLKARDNLLQALEHQDAERILGNGLIKKAIAHEHRFASADIPDDWYAVLESASSAAAEVILALFAQRNAALARMAHRFQAARERLRSSRGILAFDDVPVELLLAAGNRPGYLTEFFESLGTRIDHVLLDEFQDTSLTQFALLRPLLTEASSGSEQSLFVVGDPKQSLYGWRHAAPALLQALPEVYGSLKQRELTTNWRSSPVIIDTVNDVFRSLRINPALASNPLANLAATAWDQRFSEHAAQHSNLAGHARLVMADQPDPRDKIAIDRVQEILERAPHASIAILLRTNKQIPSLVHKLQEIGIEPIRDAGAPLIASEPVSVLVSMFSFMHDPRDSMSAAHVARSSLGEIIGLADPRDEYHRLRISRSQRSRLTDLGPSEFITEIHRKLRGSLADRDRDALRIAADATAKAHERGATLPGEFAKAIGDASAPSHAEGGVRIMTIHASKGLEFDAVICPDLDNPLAGRPDNLLVDRPNPLGDIELVSIWPNEQIRSLDPRLAAAHDRHKVQTIEEGLCVLYVAMTRARFSLDLIVQYAESMRGSPTAADVLVESLAQGNRKPGILWSSGHAGWTDHLNTPAIPPEPRLVQGTVRPAPGVVPARLASRAPSSRRDNARRAYDILNPHTSARSRGERIHDFLAGIIWLEETPDLEQRLIDLRSKDPDAASLVGACLESTAARECLSRAAYEPDPRPEVSNEQPFATISAMDRTERLLTGRFDRLVRWTDRTGASRVHIIDYKTDRDDLQPQDVHALHADQLNAYAIAAMALYNLLPEQIRASVLLVASGRLVDISIQQENG